MKKTLQAAIDAGANRIIVYCISCSRSKERTPEQALALWSGDLTFPEIAQHSRCQRCGQEASEAAAHWPPKHGIAGAPSDIPKAWEGSDWANPNRWSPNRIRQEAERAKQRGDGSA